MGYKVLEIYNDNTEHILGFCMTEKCALGYYAKMKKKQDSTIVVYETSTRNGDKLFCKIDKDNNIKYA